MTRLFSNRLVTLLLVVAVVAMVCAYGCNRNPVDTTGETKNVSVLNTPDNSIIPTDSAKDRAGVPNAALRMAGDTRQAIQLECWYALNQNVLNTRSNPSNNVGNWSYITNDMNAYNWIKARNSYNISCWFTTNDGDVKSAIYAFWGSYKPRSFYSDIYGYAAYTSGHAMQCRPFVQYILYRSGTYQSTWFPSYKDVIDNFNGNRSYTRLAGQCRVGDILQTQWKDGHSMIVTEILAGVPGQSVSAVRVVDANWVTGRGNEVIGRHDIHIIYPGQNGDGGLGDLDSYITIDVLALGAR